MKPQMNADARRLNEITRGIIGCAYRVGNKLGAGFLEKVYEKSLAHELRKSGFGVEQQAAIKVHYDGVVVGDYLADLLFEECVCVELKVAKGLEEIHLAQCLNYLRAARLKVCLLINFGTPRVQIKRIVDRL